MTSLGDSDYSETPGDLDESIAEFVQEIEDLSRQNDSPGPGSTALVGPVGCGLPAAPRSSIDLELERIVRKLDMLHESLSAAHQASARRRPDPELFSAVHERRASVHLFSSTVKSSHRRDYVLGFSITARPRANGFPRVWHIMSGIVLMFGAAIWAGSRYTPELATAAVSSGAVPALVPVPLPAEPAPRSVPQASAAVRPPPASATVNRVEPVKRTAAVAQRSLPRATPLPQQPRVAPPALIPAPPAEYPAGGGSTAALNAIRKIAAQAGSLADQSSPETPQPAAVEVKDTPPVATIKILPAYPAEARRARVTGNVELLVSIDENGRVVGASPVGGPEPLHAAAVEAMMQWHFRPAVRNGVTVPSTAKYSIAFGAAD